MQTSDSETEELSELLTDIGELSVTYADSADQPIFEPPPNETPLWKTVEVVALFDSSKEPQSLISKITQQYSELKITIEELEDQDWSRAWMDDFTPLQFGKKLWIVPSWLDAPDPTATNIVLDPGLAFGTGTHATTALCLQWLAESNITNKTVVDYGCGSGVLAVAAALLGAHQVIAIDNDPQAITATADNAKKNNVAQTIQTKLVTGECSDSNLQADIVVANILSKPLISLSDKIASMVKTGGSIALSGILPEQSVDVKDSYLKYFALQETQLDGWVRLSGTKI